MLVVLGLMSAVTVEVMATCNCTSQGECSDGVCCFSAGACGPDDVKCKRTGILGSYSCTWEGDACTYQGGDCSGDD